MSYEFNLQEIVAGAAKCETVWGWNLAKATYPIVTLFTVSEPVDHTYDGAATIQSATVQLDVFAKTYLESVRIKNALKAIDQYVGEGVVKNIMFNTISSTTSNGEPEVLARQTIRMQVWFTPEI